LDLEKAEKWLRERAAVIAKKKSGRAAAEGVIAVSADTSRAQAVMVELLCETDFAARSPSFLEAAGAMAQKALALSPEELTSFSTNPAVQEAIQSLAFTLRENVTVRRATRMAGDVVGWYVHNKQDLPASLAEAPERATNKIILGQKAALVELSLTPAGNIPKSVPSFADSVALHAVAMSPKYLTLEEATAQDPQAEQSEVLLLQDFTASDDSQTVEKVHSLL
jgi:translation elongation factor EF-Ts